MIIDGTFSPGQHDFSFGFQLANEHTETAHLTLPTTPHLVDARVFLTASADMGLLVEGFEPSEPTRGNDGQHALLTLIAADLDNRNPQRRLWAAAEMSARLLSIPDLEPWMVPVGESYYLLAVELVVADWSPVVVAAGLVIGVVAVSFSSILIRWADAPPLALSFWRCFGGALALAPFAARARRFCIGTASTVRPAGGGDFGGGAMSRTAMLEKT